MDDSKNWHELIDSLFNWYHGGRIGKDSRPFFDNELYDAPHEAQAYAIKRFLRATHSYARSFNYLIDFLPDEYLPEIAEAAIVAIEVEPSNDRIVEAIARISDQQPTALHPYLGRLFEVMTHQDKHFGYDVQGSWRGASNIDGLKAIISDKQLPNEIRAKACECLLETRNPEVMLIAIKEIEAAYVVDTWLGLDDMLKQLGFEWNGEHLRQLYSDMVYHLIFQKEYRLTSVPEYPRPFTRPEHPTYHLDTSHAKQLAFGGVTEETCWICQGALHHVITITPELTGLVHSRQQVELVTCLSCLYMAASGLFYRHDESGKAIAMPHGEPIAIEELNSPGFMPTKVALVQTPSRWQWQDNKHHSDNANLSRLGGNPYWLQYNAEYLDCPECGKRMDFLMQLMDGLPEANGTQQAWGDTGIGYFFWCDKCAISGFVSVTT